MAAPEVTSEALECLTAYEWPGNVRELRNVAERLVLKCRDGKVDVDKLPAEVVRDRRERRPNDEAAQRGPVTPTHQVMFDHMLKEGASFWSEVYEPFMARDLTRHEVRELVRLGLEHTRGNYKLLVSSFNMPPEDYKKFLNFLRKYQCHVPFQRFRMMTATLSGRSADSAIA